MVTTFTGAVTEPPAPPPDVAATAPILDIVWRAESIRGEAVVENADITLSIERDMRAGGRGGCNSYFAQAALEGRRLRFSAVADARTFFMRSTWFDTDFMATGIVDDPQFDALSAAVRRICDAYAVDERRFDCA